MLLGEKTDVTDFGGSLGSVERSARLDTQVEDAEGEHAANHPGQRDARASLASPAPRPWGIEAAVNRREGESLRTPGKRA